MFSASAESTGLCIGYGSGWQGLCVRPLTPPERPGRSRDAMVLNVASAGREVPTCRPPITRPATTIDLGRRPDVAASGSRLMAGSGALHIGLLAPPWVAVPPQRYGGVELMIDALARGLDRLGHRVTLFATGDASCPVDRAWCYERAAGDRMGSAAVELGHVAGAYEELASCDLIH